MILYERFSCVGVAIVCLIRLSCVFCASHAEQMIILFVDESRSRMKERESVCGCGCGCGCERERERERDLDGD